MSIKTELQRFFLTLSFYTRLPIPPNMVFENTNVAQTVRYFPMIGWMIGGSAAGIFLLGLLFFSVTTAIILSMITTILLTGAFHEDGFADFCDGFGGGWTKTQILTIMKDSAIGTYGSIGLISIFAMKFTSLHELSPDIIPMALIIGHTVSRFTAITFLHTHTYVRTTADSKVPISQQPIQLKEFIIAAFFTGLSFLGLFDFYYLLTILPIFALRKYFSQLFTKKLGGYTGDCLGAVQQLSEITFYLSLAILQ